MAKRRLTKQQSRQIKANQNKFRQGNSQAGSMDESSQLAARVVTRFGKAALIETQDNKSFRCAIRQNIDLVCGDHVIWQKSQTGDNVIVAVEPRKNSLVRPDFANKLKPVAANIDKLWIVASIRPKFDTILIDQYLIAAEHANIPPAIILNKIDLASKTERKIFESTFQMYQSLGYPLFFTSSKENQGITELETALNSLTSVFVGQSGVGKSSLINNFHPELAIETGEISAQTGLGNHTTSRTSLYHLPNGGELIDSPGVREFALWHLSASDIMENMIDFRAWSGQCKFTDCTHIHEPECAILKATEEGKINQQRYDNYLIIRQRLLENQNR
jgi:ribosome biogenesis GTPase / thiamine phosphate phosphatase